ncbi:phosphopantetheine-binding protein [Paracoccus zhejiangensis]|uniref:Isochorismatase n=1 Tax=Paracoccus zhejiangensis TaxID=1077935 RepID=A0A2H5F444_9RHOB|nr:phosphopantetheine-binding protein [Paracoccus zhejiangensis]AUH66297.1 isochorismatase [Paracoccus zhejiangensis]
MTTIATDPLSRDWLTRQITDLIGEDEPIDPAESLVLYGLDSIAVMRLVLALEERGVIVGFDDLARDPTLDGWWALIAARTN